MALTTSYPMPGRIMWTLRDAGTPLRFKSLCIRCGVQMTDNAGRSTISMALRYLLAEGSIYRVAWGVYTLAPPVAH